MLYQHYYYKEPSTYHKSRLNSAMSRWHGGAWETFKSGYQEASEQYTALGWLAEEAKESFVDDLLVCLNVYVKMNLKNRYEDESWTELKPKRILR